MSTVALLPDQQAIPTDAEDIDAWGVYKTAVDTELDKLNGQRMTTKRRNTVWRMAWQKVTPGVTQADVHKERGVCSPTIFHNKWMKDGTPFADVLEDVTQLTRRYVEGKNARRLEHRRAQLHEMEWDATLKLSEKVGKMLAFPLQRALVSEDVIEKDGHTTIIRKTIIEPADWRFSDAPRAADVMSKLGRRATGMDRDGISEETAVDSMDGMSVEEWREERERMMEASAELTADALDILDMEVEVEVDIGSV